MTLPRSHGAAHSLRRSETLISPPLLSDIGLFDPWFLSFHPDC
jgi:hypothetical protein